MRVESGVPMKNGGWLHRGNLPTPFIPRPLKSPPVKPASDFNQLLATWRTADFKIEEYAQLLGVSATSLKQLEVRRVDGAWAFPMRNGAGEIIGIRMRANNGQKWAVKGSHNGIFIPIGIPPQDTVWICEGPTDTAAALSMGLFAVGRPSCNCGGPEIRQFCVSARIRKAVVVADNDAPGLRGAKKIAGELKMATVVICPPAKDMREFYRQGGTLAELQFMVNQNIWRTK